jgi:hypothetical protein
MRSAIAASMLVLTLSACSKGETMDNHQVTWTKITQSMTPEEEAMALRELMDSLKAQHRTLTLSITGAAGADIPVSQWHLHKAEPLVVKVMVDGVSGSWSWQPKAAENMSILLSE